MYCGYLTDSRAHIEKHKATHSEKKEFKCTQCNYSAIIKHHLTSHVYRHHNSNRTFKCKYKQCGVKKPSQEELYEHIRNEHPMKKHRCDVCPMSFGDTWKLSTHKLTHSGIKPYQCEYGGKGFKQESSYNKHQMVHSGAKPHSCDVCGKTFTQKGNLERHMRIHTGEKPFACSYCGKRFNQSQHLTTHLITCSMGLE